MILKTKKWYEKPLRVFDLALEDPHGQWLDRWTAKEVVETVRQVNANVVNMMIVNEWGQAYFQAGRLPAHPQLNGSDRLAELIEEAKQHELKVVGMWGPTPNPILYEQHPDWAKRSCSGDVKGWGYLHDDACIHICHNSPYGQIVLDTLEELFAGYRLDGIAFDYLEWDPCHCRYCRDKFFKASGLDTNDCETWSDHEKRQLTEWCRKDVENFVTQTTVVAHKYDRVIISWLPTGDVIFAEPHTGGMINLKDKGFLIRCTEMTARIQGKPTVICTPYAHLYYVGLSKPASHMRQEFREIVLSGASPWPVIWDWELVRDRRGLGALGEVFGEVKAHEAYLTNGRPLRHAALWVSQRADSLLGDEAYRHIDAAKGWYDALTRAHIPVDVIADEQVNRNDLSGYRILILANALYMTDDQVEAVKHFVSQGGGLIASYKSSLFDGDGVSRRQFGLAEVLGCEFQAEVDAPWTYIGLNEDHPVSQGFEPGLLIMHGEVKSLQARLDPGRVDKLDSSITLDASHQAKVIAGQGSQVVGTIFDSEKPLGNYFVKDLAPALPGKDTGNPAVVVSSYGKGKVIYLAGQLDRLFYRIGHPDYERLLLNCLAIVGGSPAVTISAPTTVETTFYEQPAHHRIVIHLLNHTYDQLFPAPGLGGVGGAYGRFSRGVFRPIGDIIPVHNIHVSLCNLNGKDVRAVYSMTTSEPVPFELSEKEVNFSLPTLEEYKAFVVQMDQ